MGVCVNKSMFVFPYVSLPWTTVISWHRCSSLSFPLLIYMFSWTFNLILSAIPISHFLWSLFWYQEILCLSRLHYQISCAFGQELCTLDILAIFLIFSDYVSGTILSHFPLLHWYINLSIDPCWFAHCHVYSLFNIVFTQALLCLGRAVREKLQRLETRMNVRVKALWGCHGLLSIQDSQKMCSVGWQCSKVIIQPRKSLWMRFLITLSWDAQLEPNPPESAKKKNEGDSLPFLFPQLNYSVFNKDNEEILIFWPTFLLWCNFLFSLSLMHELQMSDVRKCWSLLILKWFFEL